MLRANIWARLSLALILFLFAGLFAAQAETGFRTDKLRITTTSGAQEFSVELAETRAQQFRGLMFRRTLGPRQGMLFLHKEPTIVTMWMRNTSISLDMLFIKKDGRIHRIEESTEPFSERIIESGELVTAVLEIAAGMSANMGIKPGDLVHHKHFGTEK